MNEYNQKLNVMIAEIEKMLTEQIDYSKLAKIIGTSEYTMQRIFLFLTGITLADYIRRRRLSKAAEDLQRGKEKIIDIAIKYQYDSPTSFARAFQKMHHATPSQIKKKEKPAQTFNQLKINPIQQIRQQLEYRIEHRSQDVFYGLSTGPIDYLDTNSIRNLYDQCHKDGTMNYIIEHAKDKILYYGASRNCRICKEEKIEDKLEYYLLGKEPREDFKTFVIPEGDWAFFRIPSNRQVDILRVVDEIYNHWLMSSSYYYSMNRPDIEIYYDTYCEYGIPIE